MPRKYLRKRLNSFGYALKGIAAAFRSEPNMKLHVLAAVEVIFLGWFFDINRNEWCWLALAIGLVWMAEIFNTALEKLTDLVSPEFNELAGLAKDLSAGAVLMASFTALAIGIIIFWPYVEALPLIQEWLKSYR